MNLCICIIHYKLLQSSIFFITYQNLIEIYANSIEIYTNDVRLSTIKKKYEYKGKKMIKLII